MKDQMTSIQELVHTIEMIGLNFDVWCDVQYEWGEEISAEIVACPLELDTDQLSVTIHIKTDGGFFMDLLCGTGCVKGLLFGPWAVDPIITGVFSWLRTQYTSEYGATHG